MRDDMAVGTVGAIPPPAIFCQPPKTRDLKLRYINQCRAIRHK